MVEAAVSLTALRAAGWSGGDAVADRGEAILLKQLIALGGKADADAEVGPGDDAAAWLPPTGALVLWTTDTISEDVDFRRRYQSPYQVGWKAWMAAVSDISAMGARPRGGLVAASIPAQTSARAVEAIQLGVVEAAAMDGAVVMGGDVGETAGPLTLTVTVMGEMADGRPVTLGGGSAGEALIVTGELGLAAAALQMLERDEEGCPVSWRQHLLEPRSRASAGVALRRAGATAMTDISDGLLLDLGRICQASGTGADVWLDRLPTSDGVASVAPSPEFALTGGEDFELLAAVPESLLKALLGGWTEKTAPLSVIGELTARPGVQLFQSRGGEPARLPATDGFRHF